jgi:hypothetical protein
LLVNEKSITALNREESTPDEEVIFPGINTLIVSQKFEFDARKSLLETLRSEVRTKRRVLALAQGLRETLRQRKLCRLYYQLFFCRLIVQRY